MVETVGGAGGLAGAGGPGGGGGPGLHDEGDLTPPAHRRLAKSFSASRPREKVPDKSTIIIMYIVYFTVGCTAIVASAPGAVGGVTLVVFVSWLILIPHLTFQVALNKCSVNDILHTNSYWHPFVYGM